MEESIFKAVICRLGDIDANDSSIPCGKLAIGTLTSLEGFTWAIKLLHYTLPMKHLQEYNSDAVDITAFGVRQWGVQDFL